MFFKTQESTMKDTSALLISTTLGWISATEGHLSEDEVVLIQY